MKVLNDLVANNKKVYNISLLLSFCLVAIAGIVEIDEFHEVAGYVFFSFGGSARKYLLEKYKGADSFMMSCKRYVTQ